MDRRHGKRALPWEASEEEEEEEEKAQGEGGDPNLCDWLLEKDDMSAMVSALTQVIGTTPPPPLPPPHHHHHQMVQSSPPSDYSAMTQHHYHPSPPPAPLQDQGTQYVHTIL